MAKPIWLRKIGGEEASDSGHASGPDHSTASLLRWPGPKERERTRPNTQLLAVDFLLFIAPPSAYPRASRWAVRSGTFEELNCSYGVKSRSHAELIAEAEQAFAAARRLVDEQSAIVQRLERTGGCNSEAVDLLNNLRELLAARERRLARVRSWPSWDRAA
jgi:hypothetical protein